MKEKDYSLLKYRLLKYSIILAVISVLAAIGVYLYVNRELNYSGYSVVNRIEVSSEVDGEYVKFGEGVVRYTTEGISYFSGGREVWNKAISIQNPVLDVCGDYVVIGEKNKNQLSVISKSGEQTDMSATYPIIGVEVSGNGYAAINMDDGEANYIELRDKAGDQVAIGRTVLQGDGYPIDIDLSTDGTKIMASYLSVDEGVTQSSVVFYNFSAVGQNEVDRIVGGFNQYKDSLVPKVVFADAETALAYGTNLFTIYEMKQKPKLVMEEKLEEEIQSVFYGNGNAGMVFKCKEDEKPYHICTYDKKGKKRLDITTDFQYKGIEFVKDRVLLYGDYGCQLISKDGEIRFETKFEELVEKMYPIAENRYVMVSGGTITEIQLTR